MKTGADKIAIQQAYEDGEEIRCRRTGARPPTYRSFRKADDGDLTWDWAYHDYEIAPSPEPQVGDVWELSNTGERVLIQGLTTELSYPIKILCLDPTTGLIYNDGCSRRMLKRLIHTRVGGPIADINYLLTDPKAS